MSRTVKAQSWRRYKASSGCPKDSPLTGRVRWAGGRVAMALRIYDASNWVTVDEGFKVGDAIFSEAILTYSMYIELGNSTPLYFLRNLPRNLLRSRTL